MVDVLAMSNQFSISTPPLVVPHYKILFGIQSSLSNLESPTILTPIRNLNPYEPRWTIKGRVTIKSEIVHYKNPQGVGQLFSFDLIDIEGK